MKDIIEHIAKARNEAFKRAIVVNTVVVNEDIAVSNGFYFPTSDHSYLEMPPMVMGMKVAYDKNSLPDNVAFAISEDKRVADNKLEQLQLIEDELGIDLITLFKALKNGVWFRPNKNKPHNGKVWLRTKNNKWVLVYRTYTVIEIEDYGKTWALTEEELL